MTAAAKDSSSASAVSAAPSGGNERYTFDEQKLATLRQESPWQNDPKYFQTVAISPSAVMKMMTHCHSGVEKGIKKGGNPIEVMGLLLGRPDPTTPTTLVVTDVFPLPIEGFETRVIADDGDVINHMIALGESLENTRKEKFMGWYHSHPFDVGVHSHCFLSQTDISTQLQWQRAEDPHGNPFLAIVVDPLRSLAKNSPELKAFRAYPPEYTNPVVNQCPDGSVIHEEQLRLEKWGSCSSAYYELDVEYFMSSGARNVLSLLNRNFLWMRALGSTPMCEMEARGRYPDRVEKVAKKIHRYGPTSSSSSSGGGGGGGESSRGRSKIGGGGGSAEDSIMMSIAKETAKFTTDDLIPGGGDNNKASKGSSGGEEDDELGKACQEIVEIATEKLVGNISQMTKKDLFSH
jgi:COP9 signalosome complex subunit 5